MKFVTLNKYRLLIKSTTLLKENHINQIFHHDENKQRYEFFNQNDIFNDFHDLDEVYHVSQTRHYNGIHQPLD